MAETRRRRNRFLWPMTQVLFLFLPLIVAVQLAMESTEPLDQLVAADLVVALTVPWALLLCLILGVGGTWFVSSDLRGDGAAIIRATGLRLLAVLAVAPAALWAVQPLDLFDFESAWRRLGTWLAVGAVPLWASATLVRARGRRAWTAFAVAGGQTLVLTMGVGLVCRALFIHPLAALAPLASAGVVASVGTFLAVTERVPGRLREIVGAVFLLAGSTSTAMAFYLAHAPIESAWVVDIAAVDPEGRVGLLVQEPNTELRILEVDLATGEVRALPRRVNRVMYVPGYRFELRASMTQILFGRQPSGIPCRTDADEHTVCADVAFPPGTSPVSTHPRLPLVVAGSARTLLGWNLRTDTVWSLARDRRIRWPCLTDAGDIIWRIQTTGGPYEHERLRLGGLAGGTPKEPVDVTSAVESLPLDHGERCVADAVTSTKAEFVRGRRAVGRVAMIAGPGLPAGGQPIPGEIGGVAWSGDGTTAALAIGRPRTVRFYREDLGLTEPVPVSRLLAPVLSRDGRWLAHRVDGTHSPYQIAVRSVPDAGLRVATTTEASRTMFDGRGRVLRIEDGRLRAVDPATGEDEVIFPREP